MIITHPQFAGDHSSHRLHQDASNDWIDANCYTDLWIELLHGLGLDPHPMLACTLGIDFEGDQWTFFKPAQADLRRLYGIEVIELAIYRSLSEHTATHLQRGQIPVLEADAYYLPDVPAAYRQTHTKTTVAVVAIDTGAHTARYLHNAARFTVVGDDYDGLFRVHQPAAQATLPPYVEAAKVSALRQADPHQLARAATALALEYVNRPGRDDAMNRFLAVFERDVRRVTAHPAEFDGYAFATLRQLGAASALAARFCHWLATESGPDLTDLIACLDTLSSGAKRLILKAARTVSTGRALSAEPTYAELNAAWSQVTVLADRSLAGSGLVRDAR